ncbi:formin-2-like [Phocoena sinus]|uniref:formin-2-like n=1 Tax=Phocoena sinus TaxID=42100 RepID=UPI0013C522CB|nr:formin-2-like [Phocoena sinus]XP_032480068.1 formin-2-like [Phocoena sinus]XP_032480069.1 formin-2-like [Phocoena sinus]XP_032480070.1 formin-2-like [Phocoena sinus]XP_032480071.1 formin-2-like [Phocoena sinus]
MAPPWGAGSCDCRNNGSALCTHTPFNTPKSPTEDTGGGRGALSRVTRPEPRALWAHSPHGDRPSSTHRRELHQNQDQPGLPPYPPHRLLAADSSSAAVGVAVQVAEEPGTGQHPLCVLTSAEVARPPGAAAPPAPPSTGRHHPLPGLGVCQEPSQPQARSVDPPMPPRPPSRPLLGASRAPTPLLPLVPGGRLPPPPGLRGWPLVPLPAPHGGAGLPSSIQEDEVPEAQGQQAQGQVPFVLVECQGLSNRRVPSPWPAAGMGAMGCRGGGPLSFPRHSGSRNGQASLGELAFGVLAPGRRARAHLSPPARTRPPPHPRPRHGRAAPKPEVRASVGPGTRA